MSVSKVAECKYDLMRFWMQNTS